ncbi:acyl-CoA dehydrogenase family protein [Myroides pelagicus]|uniref:Hydroxylase n=1 Tax=Myroides pelagicus TaxID=270914 RepID=A0A7K1GJ45_9FLAO|nr:acyl-CoA dehydrogenase family protein [Myroides pelagicus]MTH28760.1 hydroxylase [Myroides pelagicus]
MIKIALEDKLALQKSIVAAEEQGHLTKEQLTVIYKYNLFNLFVPKEYGGLALDFIDALELQEEIACIDGSLGWTVALCSGANMFVGYLDQGLSKQLFADSQVCFGGSGKVGGVAIEIEDGYIVSGHWKVATGLHHCTVFTANCKIERDGKFVEDAEGNPIYQSFCFLPDEVEVVKEWNTMGLIATGSDSFTVNRLKVSRNRAFSITKEDKVIDNALFSFPFLPFAKFTLAVNHLGIQAHFIALAEHYFNSLSSKTHAIKHQSLLGQMKASFLNRKIKFYQKAQECWQVVKDDEVFTDGLLAAVDKVCEQVVFEGRKDIVECMPYLGLTVINKDADINRVFRDLMTAGQHSLFL